MPKPNRPSIFIQTLPWFAAIVCAAAFVFWAALDAPKQEPRREPVKWDRAAAKIAAPAEAVTTAGAGVAAALAGSWPQFRGPNRDNIAETTKPLARSWPAAGPKLLWRLPVGEGFAGAAIHKGKVYLLDYDRDQARELIRCLSLSDGQEIWRTAYPLTIKRNHGMTRTVPAVNDRFVVTISPRCLVYCCDALTGRVVWKKDLKAEYGTVEPQWYAGQCPLIDGDRVILAPAGKPLMLAVDLATGNEIWRAPGHDDMGMTHSSIAPATLGGVKQYLYCANKGAVGVDAGTGRVLWTHPWIIKMATIPAPVPVGEDRVFFTGGYNAGSLMIRLVKDGDAFKTEELFRLRASEFSSDQHTPIYYRDKLYATCSPAASGRLKCLDPSGKAAWTSDALEVGLGPMLLTADGLALALDDHTGTLHLGEIVNDGYKELASAKVVDGVEPWAPMALADARLILRDMTEMKCYSLEGD